jgi:hypothetical protein
MLQPPPNVGEQTVDLEAIRYADLTSARAQACFVHLPGERSKLASQPLPLDAPLDQAVLQERWRPIAQNKLCPNRMVFE